MEFIRYIAETRNTEYNMGIDDYDPNVADDALIVRAVRKLKAAEDEGEEVESINMNEPLSEEQAPLQENMAMGLMARGI